MQRHTCSPVIIGFPALSFLAFAISAAAQTATTTASATSASAKVPPVIQFANVATDAAGGPLTGTVEVTFSLYNNSVGGASLWTETQNVKSGQLRAVLGVSGNQQAAGRIAPRLAVPSTVPRFLE